MKALVPLKIALVALTLCAHETFAASRNNGEINIHSSDKNGNFYCDGLICPKNTDSCEVTRRNDPKDFEQLIRVRKCLSNDGTVLQDQLIREPNQYHTHVNTHVNSGGAGRELTPEEERQLQLYLDNIERKIAAQAEENMANLNRALKPLQDGSFAADLQSRFGANWQNGDVNVAPVPPYRTYGHNVNRRFGSDMDDTYWDDSDFNEAMRPFRDGSFGENLRSEIRKEFRESMRDIF